jgi:hypothetical protein
MWRTPASCVGCIHDAAMETDYDEKIEHSDSLLKSRKLLQQLTTEYGTRIEDHRLDWIANNQKEVRAEKYSKVMDILPKDDDTEHIGTKIVLVSSHQGSPRDLQQRAQDGMAMVRILGKPHLFITMTCNPNWGELKDVMTDLIIDGSVDCPTFVDRIFKLKWEDYMRCVTERQMFGHVIGFMWVVEFQKRGLPHAHALIILDPEDSPKKPDDFDEYVCAEIPDEKENKILFDLVTQNMVHVCGDRKPGQPCCNNRDKKCTAGFPKKFSQETKVVDGKFPEYRRRSPADGGQKVIVNEGKKNEYEITNEDIVPYNARTLLKTRTHFNVEICSSISAVQYLFKYLLKGPDHIGYKISPREKRETKRKSSVSDDAGGPSRDISEGSPAKEEHVDEVTEFRKARWWCAPESFWKIAGFTRFKQWPNVVRLAVHLEGEQQVLASLEGKTARQRSDILQRAAECSEKSKLIQWLNKNKSEKMKPDATFAPGTSAPEILFPDMPKFYRWDNSKRDWFRRKKKKFHFGAIARLYSVAVKDRERFFLRMLMYHVRGPTCFSEIRIVDGKQYDTYREACLHRHLLQDDSEWKNYLDETKEMLFPNELRNHFVDILIDCHPSDPHGLFWQ